MYLAVLAGCVIFDIAYGQWMSWLVLMGVVWLPLAGLVFSLPAMVTAKPRLHVPGACDRGDRVDFAVYAASALPVPLFRSRVRVRCELNGQAFLLNSQEPLPTAHCGAYRCSPAKVRIYDYLGLFFLTRKQGEEAVVLVRPKPLKLHAVPQLERQISQSWRPRPGGGFSEQHELRLYRPGDSMNQVHWKLSAKTGKYIIREAMEPAGSTFSLNLELRGSPEELDRKLGRLLWLSRELLAKGQRHEFRALTGDGLLCLPVTDGASLSGAMDKLLRAAPAAADAVMPAFRTGWQYTVGGEPDEG